MTTLAITKDWFLMSDIKKRELVRSTWIPIYASKYVHQYGRYGQENYIEEFFCSNSIVLSSTLKENVDKHLRNRIIQSANNTPFACEDEYTKAGTFSNDDKTVVGEYLVLIQHHPLFPDQSKFQINQDLVLALDLFRHGDTYIRPQEDDVEVIRFIKNSVGKIDIVEMKKDLLLDYLSARNSCLVLDRFHHRRTNSKTKYFDWDEKTQTEEGKDSLWEARQFEIHEGGNPKGSSAMIVTAKRTDIDYEEDVPEFSMDGSIETRSVERKFSGDILTDVFADYWHFEILDNVGVSQRIRHDELESSIPFVVDNDGRIELPKDFRHKICWLWFKPDVVLEIMKRDNAILSWYSSYTGAIGPNPIDCVHFGENRLGYINVFAKDIADLPEIYKKLWSSYNVVPEGKVSKELLMAQMKCNPAPTQSPEKLFPIGISEFKQSFKAKYHKNVFRQNKDEIRLLRGIHRYQAINMEGLFRLAKIITKYLIERMDLNILKELTSNMKKETGSIKRLESLLTNIGADGRDLTSPFVGIYELRHYDSHLGSSELADSFDLLKMKVKHNKDNYIAEAHDIIGFISYRLHEIGELIHNAV